MYGREHGNRHVTARSDHEQPRRAMGVATNSRLDCTSKLFFYFYTNSFLFFFSLRCYLCRILKDSNQKIKIDLGTHK
jgi:hypothetical protein